MANQGRTIKGVLLRSAAEAVKRALVEHARWIGSVLAHRSGAGSVMKPLWWALVLGRQVKWRLAAARRRGLVGMGRGKREFSLGEGS